MIGLNWMASCSFSRDFVKQIQCSQNQNFEILFSLEWRTSFKRRMILK